MARFASHFVELEEKPRRCTVCNGVSENAPHNPQTKYLRILRVLIEADIPNYSESGSLHLCTKCEDKLRDYSELCVQVQRSKTSLLNDVRHSIKVRESEKDRTSVQTAYESRLIDLEITKIKEEQLRDEVFEEEQDKIKEAPPRRSMRQTRKQTSQEPIETADSSIDTDLDAEFDELMEDFDDSMDEYFRSDTDGKSDTDAHKELTRHQTQSKESGPFYCSEDGCKAVLATHNQLKIHQRVHCIEKLTCEICQKRFNRPLQVEIHAQTHRGIPETQCTICDKMCPSVMSLYNHRLMHNAPLRHMCEVCGKGFKTTVALRRHSMGHTNIKPYKCDKCSKQFRTPIDLKKHAFRHTGVKPLACHLCPKRYVATSSLNLHIAEFHEKRPPKTLHYCRLCEGETVAFDRVSLLNKHMVRKHNTELEIQSWRRSQKKQELEKQFIDGREKKS